DILNHRIDECAPPGIECLLLHECRISKLAAGVRPSNFRGHAGLDHAPLEHGEMELHLFISPLTKGTTGKHSSKPNAHVNPKLFEHHGARGSITRFTAC